MLRPRGELGQLYEPRRGAGSPCVFTELCGAVGLLVRGPSAETISFPLQRFFSKAELFLASSPCTCGSWAEAPQCPAVSPQTDKLCRGGGKGPSSHSAHSTRPGSLQGCRRAGCAGRAARGAGEAGGDRARPPSHLPAVRSSRPSRVFLGRILGRVCWKGRSALRKFTEANQQSAESRVRAQESVLPGHVPVWGLWAQSPALLTAPSPRQSPVARGPADPASGLTRGPSAELPPGNRAPAHG